ncbi:glycosyltransferase family 2 protein [Paenibacillus sp. TRM 82003]|nr:glycosyltransferase family 2 protein [Paenibacillus sp. TRM 82003]
MKFIVSIGYVNRPDLLELALRSVEAFRPHIVVTDNSEGLDLRQHPEIARMAHIFEPPVPLTYTQKMNVMRRKAIEWNCDALLYMHNDAEPDAGTPERLLAKVEELLAKREPWGVVYTQFDILAAFNVEALRRAGPWDTNFPQYFSDIDYYRRLDVAGYPAVWSELPVKHHNGGMSTMKSDAYRKAVNQETWPLYEAFYVEKWGLPGWNGLPYQDGGWLLPFNGAVPATGGEI